MKNIKQLLNTTIPKNFIYYNNKASIKIQLPTTLSEFLIQYLDDNKIKCISGKACTLKDNSSTSY